MITSYLPVYRRSGITITRGEGVYLYDAEGKRYLDFASGIAVNSLGHCHPHVVAALKKQADMLWHCSNLYRMEGLERLSQRLVERSFADTVFFCNSGAEAVECGLKMIRKYHDATGHPERYRMITMKNGFHGRTLATISAGGNDVGRAGFEPLVDGFDAVPFNDLAAVEAAITPLTAGILVEPIQGEGGIYLADTAFLQGLRALADTHGLLLFFDEVQCGMGRIGTLFAYEHYGVIPDVVAEAKGIGNGFPLAACMASEKAASGMTPGSHGSTYGSNPLAMAVGNAVFDIMERTGFLENVRERGEQLRAGLARLVKEFPEMFKEVRGFGLMQGIETRVPHRELVDAWRAAGMLTAPATNNVIRVVPPLVVEPSHIEEGLALMMRVCEEKSCVTQ